MYFHKSPFESNFDFAAQCRLGQWCTLGSTRFRVVLTAFHDDIYRLRVESPRWPSSASQAGLTPPPVLKNSGTGKGRSRLTVGKGCGIRLEDARGRVVLESPAGRTLGLCGDASLFAFCRDDRHQFYGLGEKSGRLEHSGRRTKFWNTDVWADFHVAQYRDGAPDPMYVAIPYLIIKRDNTYVGLLLDNPHATFVNTAVSANVAGQMKLKEKTGECFTIGAEQGRPDLYVIYGPSLAELTRKLQRLVGCTPLPPAWALGYQQCRWGYKSARDLNDLDRKFRKHGIPCDGLWLDIDYMDGYRVFTVNSKHFPKPQAALSELRKRGRRVVPILDPGVKLEKGYAAYDDGHRADVFCRNPQGREFVGLVWPGRTVFPDFSTKEGRAWWSKQVARFAAQGFSGAWLDMNDPATGHVDNLQMLFNHGREPHQNFHNQYALGMAMASRAGFEKAHPNQRPFLISRSGCTGVSRYAAIWTGDNYSNWHHLKGTIPCSVNLALSGVPFNGCDVGGFGGDTTPDLMRAWIKACFLFPFCRNHSIIDSRQQEPWALGPAVLKTMRRYIRLRYTLRPYLYNLFAAQEESGEAILRPLFYDFADTPALPLGRIDDQFMVGPAIMQAPIVEQGQTSREVILPGETAWYSVMDGSWLKGGLQISVTPRNDQTPLYLREGTIIPAVANQGESNVFDARRVAFHVLLNRRSKGVAEASYVFDDGSTLAYRKGERSRLLVRARVRGKVLEINTRLTEAGFGACEPLFVVYDDFAQVNVDGHPLPAAKVSRLG
ncbi:MAG TPA: glycoside hydrolase family 31 protein [Planctomycetota bacterium]|jgi:alpha-glucosidase